jgi:uncharacterized membrane protein
VPWLDAARGIAVVAMVFYHFSWDLSQFGVIEVDVANHPAWRLFAKTIAASFLGLAGYALVLAHGGGIRWRPFGRRLAILVAAAGLVTLGTYIAFPGSFIFFGILHCIALSSLLALAFLRLPWWGLLLAAAFFHLLPDVYRSDAFSAPWLLWTGLGTSVPATNDYEPIFPWFGYVLAGMALARLGLPALRAEGGGGPGAGLLGSIGRWSLPIYLIHQPLLFGATLAAFRMGWV